MAIDLQNAQNIATGWGPPPKLDAPPIGSTLAAILENKYRQQALMQKNISEAIKTVQEQRQQEAYAEALRNTGLSEGQDFSGLSAADQTRMAQLLAARTPDTQRDALLAAKITETNARTDAINKFGGVSRGRGGGSGRSGSFVEVTDDNGDPVLDANGDPVQVPAGSKLGQHVISQQNAMLGAPSASVAASIATKMGIPPQAVTDTGTHQGMGLVPGSGVDAQGHPYETKYLPVSPGDEPTDIQVSPRGTDPKTQLPYPPVIVQKDTLEQLRRALQGPSYRPPPAVPQPEPAKTGNALPTSKVQPTTGGADKNLAKGYGNDATSMSADDVRAAYRAGKMTREEAAARLKQLGFSD